MDLGFTKEQQELKEEVRDYFVRLVDEVEGSADEESTYTRYVRRMGEDGWLGLGWPVEYGGQARGPIDQMIFVEESHWAGVPLPLLTLNSVGPTLMTLGTEEQKTRILPGILQGKVHFAIGYSEPSAGTDLASLKTRAVRDGDEYVIDGQKIYTSAIQHADYVWLAARTDPDVAKHKGLSVFIVPVPTPGFSWTPLPTIAGDITSSTFYESVRVPAENLVGMENQGWKLITNQLNHERVALCPASGLLRSLTDVRRWSQEHKTGDGKKVIDHEWVQLHLARAHAKIEVLKLFNWKVAWAADKGLNPADASATKVYGTELSLEVYRLLLEVVGQGGYLVEGTPAALLQGRLERNARAQTIFTFGGGTNEVQRDIIAMIGMGMPRAPLTVASASPGRTGDAGCYRGSMTTPPPALTLHNGITIPQLGFGVFQIPPPDTKRLTLHALEVGYRHIDTAEMYRNEAEVGQAVRASSIDRADIFVTSKLDNGFHQPARAISAFQGTLEALDIDYVDLFLIHWPLPTIEVDYLDTWKALESLLEGGSVRAIGVSNFQTAHLQRLLDGGAVVPVINQIELHPYFAQNELREFDRAHGIATEAWSPIARGKVLSDPVVVALAEEIGRSPAQVVLRWHLQRGEVIIPKSVTPWRIAENFDLFDFELNDDQMAAVSGLDGDGRIGPSPDSFAYMPKEHGAPRPARVSADTVES